MAVPAGGTALDATPLSTPVGGLSRLLILFFVAGVILVPLLATAIGGFKELGELRTNPFGLPKVWQWENYWGILSTLRYWRILGNSLFIAGFTVFLVLAVAAPAAFAFAHLRFFGHKFLFNYLILGLTFPFATAILPLFIKVRDLGLLDTHWGIILPQVAFGQAVSILLLRNAFRQLPLELLESALVDGCGYIRFFLWITHPAVAADPGDGGGDQLRHQLEQFPAAAGGAQHDREISLDARPDGLPGRVHRRLAAHPRLHHAHHHPGDDHVHCGAALSRRRPDGRRGQGVSGSHRPPHALRPNGGSPAASHRLCGYRTAA